ncbi:superoxide dismutase family protein [Brevundimonas staleyi]|uniref:Superoxide dismutase family protein n=1 Tax=Brevundimonas staleyi TaxID=74326 RepID=A0ABW0FUJ4_9CAUL
MRSSPLALALIASSVLTAGAALAQTAAPPPPAPAPAAVATAALHTADGGDAGSVTAFAGPDGFLFKVEGKGWPEGWHGVHLHAVGTCEGPGFTSAGAHVNHADPDKLPHGLLNADGPDLGDLQNVFAHADGSAHAEVYAPTTDIDLTGGDGTSFLVHANRDDHVSQPIGGAGDRIACGVFQAAPGSSHAGH